MGTGDSYAGLPLLWAHFATQLLLHACTCLFLGVNNITVLKQSHARSPYRVFIFLSFHLFPLKEFSV